MKVVIDTNVFVSSARGGNPKAIIDLLNEGKFILCVSKPIVEEYFRVFQRLKMPHKEMEKLLFYCEGADAVLDAEQLPQLNLVEKDPDDDKFIECAVALEADFIISGDKALLEVGHYKKIKIVTPKQFLNIFHNR